MKKSIYIVACILLVIWILTIANFGPALIKKDSEIKKANAAGATQGVTLTANVVEALAFTTSTGSSIAFGNINPGTPKCDATGSAFSVTTSASNGYNMAVSDNIAGTDSPMVNSGSYIPDISATIASPAVWSTGSSLGLGVGLYAGTQKSSTTWGAGTTACDALNKYAGIPQNATTGHTVTGYHASADLSSWSWKIDVANTQKTGLYTGMTTFTVAPVLN